MKNLSRKLLKCLITVTFCLPGILFSSAEDDKFLDEKIESWQVHAELARVYSYQKKYDASIKEYNEALKEKPKQPNLMLELATVYAYKGNQEEADKIVNQLKMGLSDENIKKVAMIYSTLKDYPQAELYYNKYLEKFPGDDATRLKYAEMLSWQKKYPESVIEYQKILKSRPDDEQVRRRYGLVLIWMGENEKGAEELKKTLHD